jgi:O-antigen/teichoic acid export membrane protein
VANLVGYVGNIVQGPTCPELTFLHARRNTDGLRQLMKAALKTVVLLSAAVGLFLWFAAPVAYRIWTRHRVSFDTRLFAILLLQVVLASAWTTAGWSLIAANRHRSLACWNAGNAALSIVLAAALAPRYGVYGVAIASLLGDIICGLAIYPILSGRLIGSSAGGMYAAAGIPLLAIGGVAAPLVMAGGTLSAWQFVSLAGVTAAAGGYLCARVVFNKRELSWIRLEIGKLCGA